MILLRATFPPFGGWTKQFKTIRVDETPESLEVLGASTRPLVTVPWFYTVHRLLNIARLRKALQGKRRHNRVIARISVASELMRTSR